MAGVNKAIIVGNLGRDPEIRYSANGNAFASISLENNRKKQSGTGSSFLAGWQSLQASI